MTVGVVTDSAANLPASLAESLGIVVVPMTLRFGSHELRDGVDLAPADFYARLAQSGESVTTSGASPADFSAAFDAALGRADQVVCVTVASFVSVTHASAVLASRSYGGRVTVVDSSSATMGEGFVALAAARAAQAGASAADVEQAARTAAHHAQVVATIDTFEFLKRGGRVNALAAFAGTALSLKPVFAFRGGAIDKIGRPRSRSKAIAVLESEIRLAAAGRIDVQVAVCHAAAATEAAALLERLTVELKPAESYLTEFTPLMGAHTGPGVLAVALL